MDSLKICNILEKIFPLKDALEYDNVGKNFYFNNKNINKILVALDLTIDIAKYMQKNNIKFVIIHHPIIFSDYKTEKSNDIKNEIFNIIEKEKITCYVIHSNYNTSKIGINYKILKYLKAKEIKLNNINDVSFIGKIISKNNLNNIINDIKKMFNLKYIQYIGKLNSNINNILVSAGSGNGSVSFVSNDTDLFITGELKWSTANYLAQKNINVLLLGHYMENFFINDIVEILNNKLINLKIIGYNRENILNVLEFS